MAKTLDATTLAKRKTKILEQFVETKRRSKAAADAYNATVDEMASLQASFKEIEELEKMIGVDPKTTRPKGKALPDNRAERRRTK